MVYYDGKITQKSSIIAPLTAKIIYNVMDLRNFFASD